MSRRSARSRIAVVDDHAGMRQALVRLLEASGHQIESFASAEAFLDSGVGSRMACLILDVQLPGLSGFELRERLAAAGVCPVVIYVTAHDEEATLTRAEREGAPLLLKPVAGEQLLGALKQALQGS